MPGLKPFEVRKAAPGAGAPARAAEPYFLRPQSTPKPPRLPHAITRFLANAGYDRDSRLLIVVSTRCGNGDGTWAVRPVFSGLPRDWRRPLVWVRKWSASNPPGSIDCRVGPDCAGGRPRPPTHPKSCAGRRIGCSGNAFRPVRNAEQGDRHIGFICSYDDYGPRRASGRRWPWPLALHHLALADAVARDIVIAEDGSLVEIVKGQVLALIDSIRLTSSSINGEGRSRRT